MFGGNYNQITNLAQDPVVIVIGGPDLGSILNGSSNSGTNFNSNPVFAQGLITQAALTFSAIDPLVDPIIDIPSGKRLCIRDSTSHNYGDIHAGTVVCENLDCTNLSLVGPAGPRGPQGIQGIPGDSGSGGSSTKKFKLTSKFVVIGDSYSPYDLGRWPSNLCNSYTPNLIHYNHAASGTTTDFFLAEPTRYQEYTDNIDGKYNNLSTIIFYGYNDCHYATDDASDLMAYSNPYLWTLMYSRLLFTTSIPKDAFHLAAPSWVTSGEWTTADNSYGQYTISTGGTATLTTPVFTGRYFYVAYSVPNADYTTSIRIQYNNGTDVETIASQALGNTVLASGNKMATYGVPIDFVTDGSRSLIITATGNGSPLIINGVYAWSDTSETKRNVLAISLQDAPGFIYSKRQGLLKAQEEAVRLCQKFNLPVYLHMMTNNTLNFTDDQTHPSPILHAQIANDIKTNSVDPTIVTVV